MPAPGAGACGCVCMYVSEGRLQRELLASHAHFKTARSCWNCCDWDLCRITHPSDRCMLMVGSAWRLAPACRASWRARSAASSCRDANERRPRLTCGEGMVDSENVHDGRVTIRTT